MRTDLSEWDLRFLEVARLVSTWSKDPSTKVGAVIVDPYTRMIISTGYNGFPRGVNDTAERYNDRPTKYALVVHAEANAILNAPHRPIECTLFVTLAPCAECAKLIIQSGIARVVTFPALQERWTESHNTAVMMFKEAGIKLEYVAPEELGVQ